MAKKVDCIFSINTGRSGSHYLWKIFDSLSSCHAFHEPKPIGNGKAMRQYAQNKINLIKIITEEKAQIINSLKNDDKVYVETNHCFIKGFGWHISDYIPEEKLGVIILKRDKSRIVDSLHRVGCSPLIFRGREWISTPNISDPLIRPPEIIMSPQISYHFARAPKLFYRSARFIARNIFKAEYCYPKWLINYELDCLNWYVDEILARTEIFKKTFPKIKYYEVDIKELNSIAEIKKMLNYFGLNLNDDLNDFVGKNSNLKLQNNNPL